ncbi:MAG: alpha/beta hydrolase [Anaerolineae bacterium]|nr:alpha/beta hydrolase [Anaerolineae bacterium]
MIDNSILYKSANGRAAVMNAYDETVRRWPVQPESLVVDTRHGKTHILAVGNADAPPLFFFHGWNGSACGTASELDLPLLAQHFRIYSPDTIGQSGRSAPNRPTVKGDAYGEWIVDLLDGLKIDRAYVSGISGGGYLTLKIAAYAPERVIKGFAIASAGLISLARPPLKFLLSTIPAFIYPHPATTRIFVRAVSAPGIPFSSEHEEMARGMALLFRHFRMIGSPGLLTDAELRRITAPMYILMGEHDVACSPKPSVERAQRLIANVQTEMVLGGGHVLNLDKPGLATEKMLAFFTT